MNLSTEMRRDHIVAEVASRRFMSIGDIAARFGCSVATARRDLDALGRRGYIRRTRGGALPVGGMGGNAASAALDATPAAVDPFAEVKRRIARAASALIADGDTVGISGGTTALEVARLLRGRPLGVVTNALDPALALTSELISPQGPKVVLIGGVLTGGRELVGPLAEGMLERVRIDTLFMSVDGLSVEAGATIIDDLEAQILRVMATRARRLVIVADHRKIGRTALTRIVPISAVHLLVTDATPPPAREAREAIEGVGVRVVDA